MTRRKQETPTQAALLGRWKEIGALVVLSGGALGVLAAGWSQLARAGDAIRKTERHETQIEAIKQATDAIQKDRDERRRVIEALCAAEELPPAYCISEGIAPSGASK